MTHVFWLCSPLFLKGVLVLCILLKCGGFYVYKFVVDFQVSVDYFCLEDYLFEFLLMVQSFAIYMFIRDGCRWARHGITLV